MCDIELYMCILCRAKTKILKTIIHYYVYFVQMFTDGMDDLEFAINNCTLHNNSFVCTACPLPETLYRKILGMVIFVAIWPFIVFTPKYFPLGRPAAALLGAALMVIFVVVPQDQVYYVIGTKSNLQTLFLLLGMMILSYYYDREGLLSFLSLWIFGRRKRKPFYHVLWKACILSAVLSAMITNDATCVVITPLLLNEHQKQKRNHREICPLLLGIATSANIGSAATFFGNPQNAFIAANADISLIIFIAALLPATILGLALSIGLLYLCFFRVMRLPLPVDISMSLNNERHPSNPLTIDLSTASIDDPMTLSASREDFAESLSLHHRAKRTSQLATERTKLYSTFSFTSPRDRRSSGQSLADRRDSLVHSQSLPVPLVKASHLQQSARSGISSSRLSEAPVQLVLPGSSQATPLAQNHQTSDTLQASMEDAPLIVKKATYIKTKVRKYSVWVFKGWLVIITIIMIGLLAVPPLPQVHFNLGLVPMGAAILTMLADTILTGTNAYDAMTKVDWTVIFLFGGLFVWLQGVENTGFTRVIFDKIKNSMNLSTVQGVAVFTIFVVIGSNVLSNVPLVVLLVTHLDNFLCSGSESGLCSSTLSGLLLAWVSTIAGNFTLIGSVANLIVAEKARKIIDNEDQLTFWKYLRFGFISTLVVLFSGLPLVYFTAKRFE